MNKFNLFFLASLYFVTIHSFPLHTISSDNAKMLTNPSTIIESIDTNNDNIDYNDDNIDSNNYSEKDLDYFGPTKQIGVGSTPPPPQGYKGTTLNRHGPELILTCPEDVPSFCPNSAYTSLSKKELSRCIREGCSAPGLILPSKV